MVKKHVVILDIQNKTPYDLTFSSDWYDSGRVADGYSYPEHINSNDHVKVESYEKDNALAGCSGSVTYVLNNGSVTIGFSNPSVGSNKLGVGTDGTNVWKNMDDHDYKPFVEKFSINGVKFEALCQCTGGHVNSASVCLTVPK